RVWPIVRLARRVAAVIFAHRGPAAGRRWTLTRRQGQPRREAWAQSQRSSSTAKTARLPARYPPHVKEDSMSGFPTPRLGRALRLFMPVVLVAALAVPLLAPAKEHAKVAAPKANATPAQNAP